MKQITDYITTKKINATPEEVESIQPFSEELFKIYGYPKNNITTHPQYRIPKSPGSLEKYLIDIAVFDKNNNLHIIVECKRNNRKDGINQLKKYLGLCDAHYGVLFNGVKKIFLKKVVDKKTDSLNYISINNIPNFNNVIDNFKKKDLKSFENLKKTFQEIHSYIKASTAESDGMIVDNLIRVLFCKIYDERYKEDEDNLEFVWKESNINDSEPNKNQLIKIFNNVKKSYADNFEEDETIEFSEEIISYIIENLQKVSFMTSSSDVITDAFETIISKTLKGDHGQFFTPRNVVKFILNFLNIDENKKILDPACGTGGFIVEYLKNIWEIIELKKISREEKENLKQKIASKNIYGFDLNKTVAKISKAYMSIMGDGVTNIFDVDSLSSEKVSKKTIKKDFDLIITNPPFGKKIQVEDYEILKNYEVAKKNGKIEKAVNPEYLFIEQCINFLKVGGQLAIILPEGIFGNPTLLSLRQFILSKCYVEKIINLPTETFKPHTGIKTSVLILRKFENNLTKEEIISKFSNKNVFLFNVFEVGHDKNGKIKYEKDLMQNILQNEKKEKIIKSDFENLYQDFKNKKENSQIFKIKMLDIYNENNLSLYTNFYIKYRSYQNKMKKEFKNIYDFYTIKELIEIDVLYSNKKKLIPVGNGPESSGYFSLDDIEEELNEKDYIPFIRTSDIQDYKINLNKQWYITKEYFESKFKNKQKLEEGDIIFVKDGKSRVGQFAILDKNDIKSVIQSHLYIIKVNKRNVLNLDNYSLSKIFATSKIFKEQVRSAIFIQGTIPTISINFYDFLIPIPKNKEKLKIWSKEMKTFYENIKQNYELLNK
ncbi:MAG: hypothetical protein HPAVJP_2950 [Candidatus Hepatoplasma vulgare]|nr:MAG: hypothetical protein HPAVJP_2950 [Candidatus Hepatoplasma sp.]